MLAVFCYEREEVDGSYSGENHVMKAFVTNAGSQRHFSLSFLFSFTSFSISFFSFFLLFLSPLFFLFCCCFVCVFFLPSFVVVLFCVGLAV